MGTRSGDRVKLNVGGKEFVTSRTTLARAGRDSMLGAMIHRDWNSSYSETLMDEYFIDRNPAHFSVLLDFLRTGELHIPPAMSERVVYKEALYYGLLDSIHASKWDCLDGNRVRHAASVRGRATGDAAAVRADGEGGCCVAHGCMVHVYDWTMEELPPLSLDFHAVNDVGFLHPGRLVVSTCASVDKPGRGGMASFDTTTGKIVHRFQLCRRDEGKIFTAGALSSGETHVYASCRGRSEEYGLGTWDQSTAQQVDFLSDDNRDWALGDAGKLQWLPRRGVLLVSTLYPRNDRGHVSLVDPRTRGVVWSWTEEAQLDEKVVLDTVAMEDCNTICVVNQFDNTGFMDLRIDGQGDGHVKWSHRTRPRKISDVEEKCYSKLAASGTQLFCSSNGGVNVLCAPDWVFTSRLQEKGGGGISDIAVGGDRLFVLHNEENVFNVWETPTLVQD
uniref:BTB domain-containing protein n=1 Tax=Araucaria cunninghamii TaxID=56994 RepID=A0A0D6QSV3_ARACU